MNKNMKQICREIKQGENLDFNLPQVFNRLVTLYQQYSEIKFTMHYYTFYENYVDSDLVPTKEANKLLEEVNHIIEGSVLADFSGEQMEKSVKHVNDIRNQIISHMNILTAYIDVFQNYEYILNRIEYRFREDLIDLDTDEFTGEIIQYIFDTKDNVIINSKIKDIIGQLPVRITKTKYFDLIKDSISIYKGADKSTLDSYIYMIKTGAMLYFPEGMNELYPDLAAFRKEIEVLDYKNMTKDDYLKYSTKIQETAAMINEFVDFYYGLQEIVNHLYVMLITAPYAYMEGGYRLESIEGEMKYLLMPTEPDNEKFKSIISVINRHFLAKEKASVSENLEEKLTYTEGKQEILSEEFESLEFVLSDIRANHGKMVESLMLGRLYNCLNTSQNLLGSSLFVELDQQTEQMKADNDLVDAEYISKVEDELIIQLTQLFQNSSQNVYRAVVANTINKMPVFFQTTNDVLNYVKNSLKQCRDLAEKNACMNIIKTICQN